jgi:putative salt-induced outer membrane protein YdiY
MQEGPLRTLGIVLPFFLALNSASLFADQVAFKNGDRLTGAILRSDAKTLVIKTVVAGEVVVAWPEIQELRSDLPLHVALADGKTLVGKVTSHDRELEVATSAGAVEAPKESVVALRNDAAQSAYERSQRKGLLLGWEGAVDTGFELTRGNSETKNFRLAFRAVRKTTRNELTVYAQSIYSIDDLPNATPHITANENSGGARIGHDLTERLFLFSNTDFMSDGLQDLNLRFVLGGGVGYRILKRDRAALDLLGGINYTREDYVEIQRNFAAGQIGEEFRLKLGKNTSMIQNVAFFPNLTSSQGSYRVNFNVAVITRIVKWLGWQNNLSDDYVTNPPAGKKQNELAFTSGLRLTFLH